MTKVTLIPLLLLVILIPACVKEPDYPLAPALSNPSNRINTTQDSTSVSQSIILTCDFTDGDGDIGLTQNDTAAPYDYNFFIDYYEKQEGKFTKVAPDRAPLDTIHFNSRIPIINKDGSKKNVSGEITIENIDVSLRTSDTILLRFYLLDRALNKSNILETGEIIIPRL